MSNQNWNPEPSGYEPSSPNLNPDNQPPAGGFPPPPPPPGGFSGQPYGQPQYGSPQPQPQAPKKDNAFMALFDTKFNPAQVRALAPIVYLLALGGIGIYWLVMMLNYFIIGANWAGITLLLGGPLLGLAIAGTLKIFLNFVITYVEKDES